MSETRRSGKQKMSQEERERRIRILKARRAAQRRRRRRKVLIIRAILAVVALLFVGGVISLVVNKINEGSKEKEKETPEIVKEPEEELEVVDTNQVLHLSIRSLIAASEAAFGQENQKAAEAMDQSRLTVEEFQKVLQQLYDQGYVLVNIHDLVKDKEFLLPKGKKPLILSQQDVSYEFELLNQGTASKLLLDENGRFINQRQRAAGDTVTGNFDFVTCLDEFVAQHSDFSYKGARGILGLTGYNGIFGYRTSDALGTSENNRYAGKYGIYDTAAEKEAVKPVIDALKTEGWVFACNGFSNDANYNGTLEEMKDDITAWKQQVESLVGAVDVLLYPSGTDIETWKPYESDDEKYTYLKEAGFRYFCAQNLNGSWIQMTPEYVRCNYLNLDGYRMYQDLYKNAGHFQGILNFEGVFDQTRPSVSLQAPA